MVVLAALSFTLAFSCSNPTGPNNVGLSADELLEFQSHYMNSYNANSSTTVTAARSTITVGSTRTGGTIVGAPYPTGIAFSTVTAPAAGTVLANYPDAGLTTTFQVVPQSRTDIHQVTAVTTYAAGDLRKTYTETYAVQDVTPGDAPSGSLWAAHPDGQWTSDDPVVTFSGTNWVQDQRARSAQVLVFANGDTRDEKVFDVATRYQLPLLTDSFLMKETSRPALDTAGTSTFSSVVGYVTTTSSLVSRPYWTATSTPPSVIGIRYYTESGGTWGSVSLERIVAENVSLTGLTQADIETFVLRNGLALGSTVYTPLGSSVLRETPAAKVMQTNLYNNVKNLTYKLTLDATGQIILVSTTAGQLIQSGL